MRIVIAGAGSVGRYLLERLFAEDHDLTVIDQNQEVLEELSALFDIQTCLGSASTLATLENAGVTSAEIFIAATDSDETNLISCLLADSLNQSMRKLARVREVVPDASGLSERIAEVFDEFINPDSEAAASLLRLFEVPGAVEVMEFFEGRIWVVGLLMDKDVPFIDVRLRELPHEEALDGMLIGAIARNGQLIIPSGEDRLQLGDEVYIATYAEQVDATLSYFDIRHPPVRYVMIYGGGGLGYRLAGDLVKRDVKVKLIESCPETCAEIAGELNDVLVLNGDGTDQRLLSEEGISDVDVFVSATGDEEKNILSGLLAKRMGAKKSAVIVTKSSYLNLVHEIGIDIVVSPHISAASTILKFIRTGTVYSAFSTRDDSAEVLELKVPEGSKLTGKALREMKFPVGVIVIAVQSGETVTIPSGETVIESGDRVVFFASRKALPKLQSVVEAKGRIFR